VRRGDVAKSAEELASLFLGTTGRPTYDETQILVTIAHPCCVCGYWQRNEWLDGEGMCEPCREAEEEEDR